MLKRWVNMFVETFHMFINQLLSITHDIYYSFDEGFEIRAIFLDISKAFDKVWHERFIYKLRQYGFSDDLLSLLTDFLINRVRRVIVIVNIHHEPILKQVFPKGPF